MNRRLMLAIVLVVALASSFLVGGFLRQAHDGPPPKRPPASSTASSTPSADPLAWYKSLPTACPPSIDPELREKFYRQGQCPTSKGAKK